MSTVPSGTIHVPGMSPEQIAAMQDAGCRPEGTLMLHFSGSTCDALYQPDTTRWIFFQLPAGKMVFRLEMQGTTVRFIHASPGMGTWIAAIDMSTVERYNSIRVFLTWSSQGTDFYLGAADTACDPVHAGGVQSTGRQLVVGEDGTIAEVDDEGVEVMGVMLYVAGKAIVQPSALNSWQEVVKAAKLIQDHLDRESADYLFKILLANQIISMLVTGFEVYLERRFIEMIGEGRRADYEALCKKFMSKKERDNNLAEDIRIEAVSRSTSPIELMVKKDRIIFQNYDKGKGAYAAAYGIRFGELGIESAKLGLIQRVIWYRHRIIHISPLLGMLNGPQVPPEEPVFGPNIIADALEGFDALINVSYG